MRCFVAVDLPSTTREAIGVAQDTLRDAGRRADVGWVDVAKLHVTLKFLGEVPEATVGAVATALAEVAHRHCAFELVAGGVGCFPGPSRPRVLWTGLAGALREIGLLAADVERACAPLGFPPEARPFRGHVTIGRVRSPRGIRRVIRTMQTLADRAFGTWTVRELVLYRSHLRGAKGSLYEPLARFPLGSGP
jgi:2'-5' RNA ligase